MRPIQAFEDDRGGLHRDEAQAAEADKRIAYVSRVDVFVSASPLTHDEAREFAAWLKTAEGHASVRFLLTGVGSQ